MSMIVTSESGRMPVGEAAAAYAAGLRFSQEGRLAEALGAFTRAAELSPDSVDARIALGVTYRRMSRFREAVAAYDGALAITTTIGAVWSNLGNALKDLDEPVQAVRAHRRAVALEPANGRYRHNLGIALAWAGRHGEAVAEFDEALALRPGDPEIRWDRARSLLAQGDFANGWRAYEARWDLPPHRGTRLPGPEWDGAPFPGKRLYLYSEQGFGDSIQCLRYLPRVKALGGTVVLECQAPLLPLVAESADIDEVVTKGEPRPAYDFCLSILSLPRLFTRSPADVGGAAYVRTPADRAGKFAGHFDTPALKVGIVWSGSVTFKGNRHRAVSLPMLLRAVDKVPGVKLYSLQKGPPEAELKQMGAAAGHITDLAPLAEDFADTAAMLDQLDLVIMTDSSVAHLAGAMGRPVWVLLGSGSHWLWLTERSDSPWYDSLRFFRQTRPGDWTELMDRVRHHLLQAAAAKRNATLPAVPPRRSDILSQRINAVAPSRDGVLLYNRHDRYVGRSIAAYGEYGRGEQVLLRRFMLPGDTVLDIGANIGAHTLFFARAVGPSGRVHAFEPQRVVFQSLCANMALNDITWVHCHWKAVGAAPGIGSMPPIDYAMAENFGGMALRAGGQGEPVGVTAIDAMGLQSCHLMKIDVEGMEAQVLQGAAETIRRCRPILYVENDRRANSAELIRLVMDFGYRIWWHLPPLFEPGNAAGNPFDIFGNVVSVNLLCCPPDFDPGQVVEALREVTGPDDWWRA